MMKYNDIVNLLNESNGNISVDWDGIEPDQFIELSSHPKFALILNKKEPIVKFMWSQSSMVCLKIDEIMKENKELRSQILEESGLKEKISVKYFQNSEKLESLDTHLAGAKFVIREETKKTLMELGENEEGTVLTMYLSEHSLYEFSDEAPFEREIEELKNKILDPAFASILVAASLTSAVVSYNFENANHVLLENRPSIELMIENKGELSSKVNQQINNLLSQVTNNDLNTFLPSLRNLGENRLGEIISFAEANNTDDDFFEKDGDSYEEKVESITKIISEYYPGQDLNNASKIANAIAKATEGKNVDYKLMLAIIKVESSFNQNAVSRTGDLSVAQINYANWAPEFKRLGYSDLNKQKLKNDMDYSVERMAEILEILSKRHSRDELWFARYHSSTPSLKVGYAKKVRKELDYIEEKNQKENEIALNSVLYELRSFKMKKSDSTNVDPEVIEDLISSLSQAQVKISMNNRKTKEGQKERQRLASR